MSYYDRLLRKCTDTAKQLVVKRNIYSMLDTGCSDGKITKEFKNILNPKETKLADIKTGVDLNYPFFSQFCSVYLYDFILSSQVIEHLWNTRLYLEECHRILKPGGQMILTTENLASWFNIGCLLFGWQPFSSTSFNGLRCGNPFVGKTVQEDPHGSHIRVLTYQGLKDLFEMAKFKDIKIVGGRHSHFLIVSAFA